jgi:hypothetical protein
MRIARYILGAGIVAVAAFASIAITRALRADALREVELEDWAQHASAPAPAP